MKDLTFEDLERQILTLTNYEFLEIISECTKLFSKYTTSETYLVKNNLQVLLILKDLILLNIKTEHIIEIFEIAIQIYKNQRTYSQFLNILRKSIKLI